MANLRLVEIKVSDSTTIVAKFTDELDPLINTGNVVVTSITPGIPNPETLIVEIVGNVIKVVTRPMTPYAAYFVEFKSTTTKFKSKNGTSFLFEDGKTNIPLVLGAEDPADPIRDQLTGYLRDNVYNLDFGSVVRDIINSQSINLSRALYDIRQAKNDNYLTVLVEDESKIRGPGPFDRLSEEGAYQIIRVGKKATGDIQLAGSISFDSFPSGPITLQAVSINSEELEAGFGSGTFNGLILTVSNTLVTKLNSVTIQYAAGGSAEYNISVFGYQLQNPRYDQDFASTLLTLENNQIKLSDLILDTSFVLPKAGDTVTVSYDYKLQGRVITEDSVTVSQILESVREVTPPILTQFTLAHAPIVTDTDILASEDGVEFLDPISNPPFSETHPAFIKELPFKFEGLPSNPGEFCIDYETGRVFVYGSDTNDGTGDFPPVATYLYRKNFSPRLDFTYDPDFSELVASPLRDLTGQEAKISFDFEDTLIPNIDFKAQIHTEILDERVENRVNATNSLSTLNSPITNVFRIFNETSGEIYKIQRWNDHTIFFTANNPPRVVNVIRERISFVDVNNELLLVNQEFANALSTRVFKVLLQNNRIISATEDVIGSSYNSSANFSRTDIFTTELYFNPLLAVTQNTDRLSVGEYQIDYNNGVVYVGVTNPQNLDLGTINYKKPTVRTNNLHIISVSELYHSISTILGVNKRISYLSFSDSEIVPSSFDISDERFLNGDTTLPYIVSSDTIEVSDDIKDFRNVHDLFDLDNHAVPTNFAEGATVSANIIILDPTGVQKRDSLVIDTGLTITVPFISTGAEIVSVTSVLRLSDNMELFDSGGSFSGYTITLSGVGSPVVGQEVLVTYRVKLNGAATPIVDYNRGDYFADYIYLADEILVSYEYGDNAIDFRESGVLDEGDTYFVTYKVGALRDALLKNFGSLVDIPILNNFDTSLPRENYRDALKAALQSFTKGPTIPSMKSLVSNISHIDPEIIEAAFQNWSLGISHLYPNQINTTGDIQLLSAKFDNGALLDNPGETISFPVSSNLRLEEGTLETWVIPEWDGLDNDATLTFSLEKDGYVLAASNIYIGADSHNPEYDLDFQFSLNKDDDASPIGLPSAIFTRAGIFIYYDDVAKRWKVLAKDKTDGDGYVYSGTIQSSGEVYDVKFIPGLGEINDVLRSGNTKIEFEFHIDGYDVLSPDGYVDGYSITDGYFPGDGYVPGYSFDGIDFMADDEHFIFDFAKTENTNRFSLFKDGKGYLNFRVYDRGNPVTQRKNQYKVSADISGWRAGEKHHVAVAWKINTSNRRDELHLFIDGTEVPNIIRYGGRPIATSSDRFRTVKPELVAGTVLLNTVVGNDLNTTAGSNIVFSNSINFSSQGIVPGNTIEIRELGFGTFTITDVNGSILTLSSSVPSTFEDARFSVNPVSFIVSSEIDLFNNIAVSILRAGEETEIPGLRADIPAYDISKNAFNQNVLTILGEALAGDQILIRVLGLNHRRCRDRQFIWGNTSNVLKTQLPPPINLDEARIIPVLLPLLPIGPSNAVFSLGVFTAAGITTSQPSNSTEGRTLAVRITGGNVDFSTPVEVTINGTTAAGPLFELVSFSSAGIQNTVNKFKTISSVTIVAKPLISSKNSVAVEIKEAFAITDSEGNNLYPVIRFSFKTQTGLTLEGTGTNVVSDSNGYFIESMVGQRLVISTPGSVAGTYTITSRIDSTSVTVTPTPATSFTNGTYDIFDVSLGRSGFQNGFFTLEQAGQTNVAYPLNQGFFDFDYSVHLEIPMDPVSRLTAFVGSDYQGNKQAKAIIDEFRIISRMLTDVRVGESIGTNEDSITTDFTKLRPFEKDSETLMLLHFDEQPFTNDTDFWVTANKSFLQSADSVNSNFEKCLVILDKPYVVDNKGLLSTKSEGSIEFWVSPRFDTYNDPNFRFYFDASGSIEEQVISTTSGTVKITGRISEVISVRLQTDVNNTGEDFFAGGRLESDFQTIKLSKALPYQQTPVKVNYIPSGLSGDRISIYKDSEGFITFNVRARGVDYQVRQPVFWERDSWHRIFAIYKFNRADNLDEIRLFVDGEERGTVLFGQNLLFGTGVIFGQGFAGVDNSILVDDINFTDPINEFFIGSDYLRTNTAYARIDNLRLSNTFRNPTFVAGQAKDINFSSNTDIVFPVVPDVFTTYLLDFNTLITKTTDLALLRDEKFGIFNFTINIIDSFGIVSSNAKIQQVLESLIFALKPAPSKVTINYVT